MSHLFGLSLPPSRCYPGTQIADCPPRRIVSVAPNMTTLIAGAEVRVDPAIEGRLRRPAAGIRGLPRSPDFFRPLDGGIRGLSPRSGQPLLVAWMVGGWSEAGIFGSEAGHLVHSQPESGRPTVDRANMPWDENVITNQAIHFTWTWLTDIHAQHVVGRAASQKAGGGRHRAWRRHLASSGCALFTTRLHMAVP